jgi:glycosyltransferase involved in cell wall biosynthesis
MQPLLSVIIPTKNRYKYLKNLVLYLAEIKSDELEIIIQDNSDDNSDFLEFIESNEITQIEYFYLSKTMSIIDNCDLAVKNSKGKYVCFLGDDDFISGQIVDVVKIMNETSIDSLSCHAARYNWPDLLEVQPNLSSLSVYDKKDIMYYLIEPIQRLKVLLETQQYSLHTLPKLYHGVVSRNVLDEIYDKCGSYFPGFSPDIANAVGVCLFSTRHLHINLPLIVAGFGLNSAAGLGARKLHVKKVDEVKMLPSNTKERWDSRIPYVWTGNSVWAASIIEALCRLDKIDLIHKVSFVSFYSKFIRSTPHLLKYSLESSIKYTLAAVFIGIPKLLLNKILMKLPFVNMGFGESMSSIITEPISLKTASKEIYKFNEESLNYSSLISYLKEKEKKNDPID